MDFLNQLDINLANILLRFGLILVVFIIGRWLAGFSRRWLKKSMGRYELTETVINLIGTVVYYSILILTIAVILGILGVPSTTIASVLGVVAIVLAITMQASLGNLAAAVNFILFKPFEVGDFIHTAGVMGVVQEMQLFSTVRSLFPPTTRPML
jgi:small conductance mechanosensitive channel